MSRATYYLRRIWEAPLHITARKVGRLFAVRMYGIVYFFKKYGVSRQHYELASKLQNLMDNGEHISKALLDNSTPNLVYRKMAIHRGKSVLDNEFQCLGYGVGSIPKGKGWYADQFHGQEWPYRYFANIDFVAADRRCDVKVPWEFSRLQFLPWLAEASLFDTENAHLYGAAFEQIARDWIKYNQPGYGVNWTCPMEVAIRACNLLLAASVLWPFLTESMRKEVVSSAEDHCRFIRNFPEFSDVPGNHYLSNLMGIAVICEMLSGSQSKRTAKAKAAFHMEASSQFEKDGCQLERAPVYHRLCLDMVALVCAFEARSSSDTSQQFWVPLHDGLAFCRDMSPSNSELPVIGDCDSGQILWFMEDARNFESLEVFMNCVEGRPVPTRIDGKALWWIAIANRTSHSITPALAKNEKSGSRSSDRSGFLSAQLAQSVCVMRVGAQGLEGRASHDHDDALSVWMSHNERDFLIEEGCHSYTLDPEIRARYIGSLAHNLVQPVGQDRYIPMDGSIVKTPKGAETARTWAHNAEQGRVTLSAELDVPVRDGQFFRMSNRNITLQELKGESELVVDDNWAWIEERGAEIRWHFAPGLDVQAKPEMKAVELRGDGNELVATLTVEASSPLVIEAFDFDFAPVYGSFRPCKGIRLVMEPHSKASLKSCFKFAPVVQDA